MGILFNSDMSDILCKVIYFNPLVPSVYKLINQEVISKLLFYPGNLLNFTLVGVSINSAKVA